jgi:hypothetical protein
VGNKINLNKERGIMMSAIDIVGLIAFWLLLVVVLLIQRIQQKNALLRNVLEALEDASAREWTTNQRVEHIFTSLSPLLEQTDWMTGRWAGQFQTLVSMEKDRNAAAVAIRVQLMALPFLKQYFDENKADLLTGVTSAVFTGIESK